MPIIGSFVGGGAREKVGVQIAANEGDRDAVGGVTSAQLAQDALPLALDSLRADLQQAGRLVPAVAGGAEGEDASLAA
jgi:hypothetical protein